MGKTIINGLTQEDIVLLYRYLAFYEKHRIKHIESEKDLKKVLPDITKIIKTITQNAKLTKIANEEIKEDNTINNEIIYINHYSISLSILYHLRNAVAHCLFEIKDKKCILRDFTNGASCKLTMYGIVDFKTLKNTIKSLVEL